MASKANIAGMPLVRLAAVLAGILLSLSLLALSLPRLAAGLLILPGEAVREVYFDRRTYGKIGEASAELWRKSQVDAAAWVDSPEVFYEQAVVEQALMRLDDPANRDAHAELARQAVTRSLALAPVNGRAWLMLAIMESRLRGDPQVIREALRASLIAAPYDPGLLAPRLRLGLSLWHTLDGDLARLMVAQTSFFVAARREDELRNIAAEFPDRVDDLMGGLDPADEASRALLRPAHTSGEQG